MTFGVMGVCFLRGWARSVGVVSMVDSWFIFDSAPGGFGSCYRMLTLSVLWI
ncbi:hypothetical protein M758_UG031900 [Ceratodon purpureus]|nr:hypothetical protein M758_UG031900 [Ceratodon purpureus]